MSHPSEAQLLAFADRELEGSHYREVEAHVRGCDLCRHALRDVEQAMAGLAVELALIDTEAPAGWPAVAAADRTDRRGAAYELPSESSPSFGSATVPSGGRGQGARDRGARALRPVRATPSSRAAFSLRWAAVLLAIVGGGAAAMVAPQWFGRAATRVESAPAAAPVHTSIAETATSSAAVSILPVAGEATVVLTAGAGSGDGRVVVELSDRSDVQVTVSTAASEHATPRFTSAEGRLAVQLTGRGALVRVSIPATLRTARITYDDKTIATVSDGVVAPAEAGESGVALPTRAPPPRQPPGGAKSR